MRRPEDAVREYLGAMSSEAMLLDGLDGALVGVMCRFNQEPVALYSKRKCIDIFIAQGCAEDEAEEHFDFNVIGAWVGDGTPAFMLDCDDLEGRVVYDRTMLMLEACEEKLRLRGESDDIR
jgi:hypothetical protein